MTDFFADFQFIIASTVGRVIWKKSLYVGLFQGQSSSLKNEGVEMEGY